MKCPICGEDVPSREFYDHMGEYHGWTLSEAEVYAEERYLEEHPELLKICSDTPTKEKIE